MFTTQSCPKIEYVDFGGSEFPITENEQVYGILLHRRYLIKGIQVSDEVWEGTHLKFSTIGKNKLV